MDKRHLVDAIAKDTGFSKTDTAKMFNSALKTISNAVAKKERVTLVGFGTFYVVTRQPRKARNPRTGALINIPKRTVPRWRASPELQGKVR
jgi:DNA-binding protein HU-beta